MAGHTFEFVKRHMENLGYEFDEETVQLYTNMYNILSEFTHGKLTFDEIHNAYDFLGDVISGFRPDILIEVRPDDYIRAQARLMEGIPETAGKLTDDEKCRFAFCVYHTLMVEMFDEKEGEFFNGLHEFTSIENIERLYKEDREFHSQRYVLADSDEKADKKKSFGYSPENPVPVTSVAGAYSYLNSLRYKSNPVSYERIGSLSGPQGGIIDKYRIMTGNSEYIIYIDPYGSCNSRETPEGFTSEPVAD